MRRILLAPLLLLRWIVVVLAAAVWVVVVPIVDVIAGGVSRVFGFVRRSVGGTAAR